MKFAVVTHVMFYETYMFIDFVISLRDAIMAYKNPEDIYIDFCLNISEYFEKIDRDVHTPEMIIELFNEAMVLLNDTPAEVVTSIYSGADPYTMTSYRREASNKYCNEVDMVIWGESDCLVPKRAFDVLETVDINARQNGINRYISTFAMRKMWDDSWKVLEHPNFENLPYYEKDHPECFTSPHSIRYNMSLEEMNLINEPVENGKENLIVNVLYYPKFDGSLLCISSDLIKFGCNIPPGIFGLSGEDTSMMFMCDKLMGKNYRQFVIKNVLKVHNREHSKKRIGAKTMVGDDKSTQANKGLWYEKIRNLNRKNLNILYSGQGKFLSWDDL